MKKLFQLTSLLFAITTYSQNIEQKLDSILAAKKRDSILLAKKKDSIYFVKYLDSINIVSDSIRKARKLESINNKKQFGRYKLYPTSNMYNFLKLDTSTGIINIVQWSTNKNKRFEYFLGDNAYYYILQKEGLAYYNDYERPVGRFELQPTTNTYNFILIDTFKGDTWQVQWSFEAKDRFVFKID